MGTRFSISGEKRFLLLLLLGGLALRLIWLLQVHGDLTALLGAGEATNVALSIARTGQFADAFSESGPTAHLLPTTPIVAGAVFWLFGPYSPAASLTLLAWCLVQVGCAVLLLRRLFLRLGAAPAVARWGSALLCLVVPFAPQETVDFRYWEGAAALCLAVMNLLLILRCEERGTLDRRTMLIAAGLSAVTFFVCPPAGLAVDTCWAIFAVRRLGWQRCVQFAALSAAALALLVTPWALRNQRALGEPVLLRSNFGLELAIANHPAAVSGHNPEYVFADRLLAIHPYQTDGKGRAALRAAGGEIAYARALGAQTWRWIGANSGAFATLSLRHLREFFFPRPWQMYFTGWEGMREARAWTISIVNLLGLIGLAMGLYRRRRGYWMLATYIAVVALPYAMLQPMSRYIYLVYGLLAFLAIEAVHTGLRYRSTPKTAG